MITNLSYFIKTPEGETIPANLLVSVIDGKLTQEAKTSIQSTERHELFLEWSPSSEIKVDKLLNN